MLADFSHDSLVLVFRRLENRTENFIRNLLWRSGIADD